MLMGSALFGHAATWLSHLAAVSPRGCLTSRRRGLQCLPPFSQPLRLDSRLSVFPRPLPDFLPPPLSLFTVAHARRSASFSDTPRFSYPSSMCSAWRFCLSVYAPLSPLGINYPPYLFVLYSFIQEQLGCHWLLLLNRSRVEIRN